MKEDRNHWIFVRNRNEKFSGRCKDIPKDEYPEEYDAEELPKEIKERINEYENSRRIY